MLVGLVRLRLVLPVGSVDFLEKVHTELLPATEITRI